MSITRGKLSPQFGIIQIDALLNAFKTKTSHFEMAIMLALIGCAKYGGKVFAPQKEIAKLANTYPSNVSKALKRLEALGFIKKEKDFIQIDPCFCRIGLP